MCDAGHDRQRICHILMATGRDATDVALTTSFGPTELTQFVVVTDEVPPLTSPPSAAAG